jgi:hypothetical protein
MRATGKSGLLRFKYQIAACLGDWILEPVLILPHSQRFRLSGSVVSRHEPWASRSPLDVWLEFGSNRWVWNGVVVGEKLTESRLVIEVEGPPRIEKGVPANV